jgi:hypothetical protein
MFCDVLCIVCVYMRTELLSPGGYPITVKYIILYLREIKVKRRLQKATEREEWAFVIKVTKTVRGP